MRGLRGQGTAGVRGLRGWGLLQRVLGFGLGDSRPCWVTRIWQGWPRNRAPSRDGKSGGLNTGQDLTVRPGPHCQARRFPPCHLALSWH